MAREVPTDPSVTPSQWHNVTLALLGGLAVASILFAHIAVVQTPGLDPPPQTAALFIVAATIATIGYLLVKQGSVPFIERNTRTERTNQNERNEHNELITEND